MHSPLITLDNLSIGYNDQAVLSGVSLSIARASFIAILGVNGSGKSTLLKTLLGLLPPVAGRIETAPAGRQVVFGYVPQSVQFDPIYLFTAFDVALMGVYGRIRAGRFVPAHERDFTHECLRAAGADEFARRCFAELSGGQKQRVLIARALATRPDILVLDEPTAGIDRQTAKAVLEFIAQINVERKITVLLVTHDFGAVRHYAGQVIWLYEGKLFHGATSELLTADRMAQIFETEIS
jgi:ABC-type Mn2+/Zn2+ transport system ATPase subunit